MLFVLIYFITQVTDISFWISRDIDTLYLIVRNYMVYVKTEHRFL